jgi:hypothetical protein
LVTYGDCSSDRMAISWIISSTSSSALSISMTLIATAWPVRLSTLNSLAKFGRCGSYYRRRTLCKLCRNCHHLRHVSTFTPKCPIWCRTTQNHVRTNQCSIPWSREAPGQALHSRRQPHARDLPLCRFVGKLMFSGN